MYQWILSRTNLQVLQLPSYRRMLTSVLSFKIILSIISVFLLIKYKILGVFDFVPVDFKQDQSAGTAAAFPQKDAHFCFVL